MSYNGQRNTIHFSNGDVDTLRRIVHSEQEHRAQYEAYFRDLEEREREWCERYLNLRYRSLRGKLNNREQEFKRARTAFRQATSNVALELVEDWSEANGDWYDQFLNVLRITGNIRAACHATGIERKVALFHYATNEDFAERWNEAIEDALDTLDAVAWKRAREGSDSLIRFLLERRRPELYAEKKDLRIHSDLAGPIDVDEVRDDPRISAQILQVLIDAGALDQAVMDAEENIVDAVAIEVTLDT